MIRNLLTVVALGGAVALVACSSSEEEKFSSSDAFCEAKAGAECDNLALSCGNSVDTCKRLRADACKSAGSQATATGRVYKAANAQGCIDAVNTAFSPKVVDPEKEQLANEACERVYSGTKAKNVQCANTYECDGTMVCDKTVCADKQLTPVGSACGDPGKVCDKGAYCQQQGPNKFCVAKKGLDEICTPDSPCKEDLRCVGGASGGSCKPRVAAGGACNVDDDCAKEAPYCDPTGKTCRQKYQQGTTACKAFGNP